MAMTTPNPGLPLWPLYVQCARRGSGLFGGDSKQLVDMVASTGDPRTVLERLDASDCSDESLLALVSECFRPPGTDLEDVYPGDVASTSSGGANRPFSRESLLQLLRSLTKRAVVNENTYSTLIPAPNPFVIPAGRFRESYYWDSYWIILGLLSCPDQWAADLCIGIVRNFAYMVDEMGFVPNGFREYYANRSQPPLLTVMVDSIATKCGRQNMIAEFLPVLKKELLFWRREERTIVEESTGLAVSRYWSSWTAPRAESLAEDLRTAGGPVGNAARADSADSAESADSMGDGERERLFRDICAAAESGWDFSSRWMDESNQLQSLRTTRILPVDLNALLAKSERTVSGMAREVGDADTSDTFARMADEREAALRTLFWDDRRGKWRDLLLEGNRAVGFARKDDEDYASDWVPLWCLGGDLEMRQRATRSLEASKINQEGGIAASSVHTGEQWDWPNAWPPLQYFLASGCWSAKDEASSRLGDSIRDRYMASARKAWGVWNSLPEKFDCTVPGGVGGGGEYAVVVEGFGWTLGLALLWLEPKNSNRVRN